MASIARCTLLARFVSHCCRRATHIRRVMRGETSFEAMLERLYPVNDREALSCELIPQWWFRMCADCCACVFPSMWRRRCLFRSLMILDWVHGIGIHATLNVGMNLGPDRDQGHCWLAIADRPFCELGGCPQPPGTVFHSGRDVRYWVCLGADKSSSSSAAAPPLSAETGL